MRKIGYFVCDKKANRRIFSVQTFTGRREKENERKEMTEGET